MSKPHSPFIRVAGDANIVDILCAAVYAHTFEVHLEADVVLAHLPTTWPMAYLLQLSRLVLVRI
jgi:hypothetical protein